MLQQPLDRHLLPLPAVSYVMKMYCPCISILGYTSQSRKSEKFINIHLNKKTLRRSSVTHFKKQPPDVFYKKAVLNLKICNIHHKKTPVLQSIFNKVAEHKACSVIKKRLQHRCFPGNIAKFLRTSILKIICKRLLLPLEVFCISNWLILSMRMLHLTY